MELDFVDQHKDRAFAVLSGLVTPRPIALVTTISRDGRINAAPFSFFNLVGASPPIVVLAPGNREQGVPKDTARNIREVHEFVVNLVDEPLAEGMNACAVSLPHGDNELENAGLTAAPCPGVAVPRIEQSPVSLECREYTTLNIGDNRLIIGLVLRAHVRQGVLDPQTLRLRPGAYQPIGRMQGPDWYCRTRDQFELKRPS